MLSFNVTVLFLGVKRTIAQSDTACFELERTA